MSVETVSLAELLSRDPRQQDDETFREIIRRLRADRLKFLSEGTRSIAAPKATSEISRLSLDVKL